MIDVANSDVGRKVLYVPKHARGWCIHRFTLPDGDFLPHQHCEIGHITSFNDHVVFVRYNGSTSAATARDDLEWFSYSELTSSEMAKLEEVTGG